MALRSLAGAVLKCIDGYVNLAALFEMLLYRLNYKVFFVLLFAPSLSVVYVAF